MFLSRKAKKSNAIFYGNKTKKGFAEISRGVVSDFFADMLWTYKDDHKVDLNPKLICFRRKNCGLKRKEM